MSVRGLCNTTTTDLGQPPTTPWCILCSTCTLPYEPQLHLEGFLVCTAAVPVACELSTTAQQTRPRLGLGPPKLGAFTLNPPGLASPWALPKPTAPLIAHTMYSFVPRDGHFFGSSARPPTEETPPATGRGWFNGPAAAAGEWAHSDRMLRVILVVDPLCSPQTPDQQPKHHQETGN